MLAVDLSGSPEVNTAFQGILAEQTQPGPARNAMTAALMTQCLVHLFRCLANDRDDSLPWLTVLQDPRLVRVIDRILENPALDHTVESLAETAAMSRSVFAEHFTTAFGRSPMSLVHHVRMQRASQLLREGALSIDEVARPRRLFEPQPLLSGFQKVQRHPAVCVPEAMRAPPLFSKLLGDPFRNYRFKILLDSLDCI